MLIKSVNRPGSSGDWRTGNGLEGVRFEKRCSTSE
jgi:hypothetical protein